MKYAAHQGFSLIEMVVVVAIVGTLGAIAGPTFASYIGRSRVAEGHLKLAEAHRAEEAFFANNSYYTADLALLGVEKFSSSPRFVVGFALPQTDSIPKPDEYGCQVADCTSTYAFNDQSSLQDIDPNYLDRTVAILRNSRGDPTWQRKTRRRGDMDPVHQSWFSDGLPAYYTMMAVAQLGNSSGTQTLC